MSEFKIESGVPLAAKSERKTKYPWRGMEVGDSFFIPEAKQTSVSSCAASATRSLGIKLATRSVTENGVAGVRVWRIA